MSRNGFSLVEVIVGMLIFTVGALALASSMGFVSVQLQAADLRTERSVAYQQATEQLFALDFDQVTDRASGDAIQVGAYAVWWDVESINWSLKEIDLYSDGPGYVGRTRTASVVDTLTVRIARPYE